MPRGLLLACLVFVLPGCGAPDLFESDAPPVQITGQVLYRGYQIPGGWIVFSADPDFGAGTDTLMAPIAFDGTFQTFDGKQSGLKPGFYRIAISANDNPTWRLPRKYHDPSTSGLRCKVELNQPLRIRFELD